MKGEEMKPRDLKNWLKWIYGKLLRAIKYRSHPQTRDECPRPVLRPEAARRAPSFPRLRRRAACREGAKIPADGIDVSRPEPRGRPWTPPQPRRPSALRGPGRHQPRGQPAGEGRQRAHSPYLDPVEIFRRSPGHPGAISASGGRRWPARTARPLQANAGARLPRRPPRDSPRLRPVSPPPGRRPRLRRLGSSRHWRLRGGAGNAARRREAQRRKFRNVGETIVRIEARRVNDDRDCSKQEAAASGKSLGNRLAAAALPLQALRALTEAPWQTAPPPSSRTFRGSSWKAGLSDPAPGRDPMRLLEPDVAPARELRVECLAGTRRGRRLREHLLLGRLVF
ncbi:serine/arginine repetitive matrix protein 1-like [Choloepus didactylus]|uniref:serine/arginine repetitive matrix protein 1-like n=1 Tax=Choloepus didactylus TaxID=27675 RepID=UPI0018A11873|nr:serine/arginine repetitive matrix protein 1-like [Choloepus didactylus]